MFCTADSGVVKQQFTHSLNTFYVLLFFLYLAVRLAACDTTLIYFPLLNILKWQVHPKSMLFWLFWSRYRQNCLIFVFISSSSHRIMQLEVRNFGIEILLHVLRIEWVSEWEWVSKEPHPNSLSCSPQTVQLYFQLQLAIKTKLSLCCMLRRESTVHW